jgi:hypothetical protein
MSNNLIVRKAFLPLTFQQYRILIWRADVPVAATEIEHGLVIQDTIDFGLKPE